KVNLDNSTNNVLVPLDSWTSGLLVYKSPLSAASRWLRNKPTGSIKTWEDLKTKFLNKYCPPGRTAKKIEEINNFQQEPDETLYHAWERFRELLMKCPQHYLARIQAIQDMTEYSQKCYNGTSRERSTETSDGLAAIHAQLNNLGKEIKKVNEKVYAAQVGYTLSKFMGESSKRHEENSNLIKVIRASTDAAIRNQGASIKTLEIQIGQMSKDHTLMYETRHMMIPFPSRMDNRYCKEEEGSYKPKFTEAIGASNVYDTIPQKEKDPRSFTLPCYINDVCFNNALVDLGASVSVMPLLTYLNLGLGELVHTKLTVELADRTVKYPKGIVENVLVGIG
ncbi:NUDIX hydrolase 6-like protein, partial [Tanacetum coccineum]